MYSGAFASLDGTQSVEDRHLTVALGVLVGGDWIVGFFVEGKFGAGNGVQTGAAFEDVLFTLLLDASGGVGRLNGLGDGFGEDGGDDSVVVDEAVFANDLERKVALAIDFGFDAFGQGAAQDRIHDLRLGDRLVDDVTLVAAGAAAFGAAHVVSHRGKVDEERNHFEATFEFFGFAEFGDDDRNGNSEESNGGDDEIDSKGGEAGAGFGASFSFGNDFGEEREGAEEAKHQE